MVNRILYSRGHIFVLGLLMAIYMVLTSPENDPDSASYIIFKQIRPPVYPIFLWLFHKFGLYQFSVAMWVQAVIAFSSLFYASNWFHKNLKLPNILIFTMLLFTTLLIFFYYKMIRIVCSEGLAFPLFIITFLLLVECFDSFNIKKLILLVVCSNILILIRAQFYYFYILFAILIAWYIWKKITIKNVFLGIMIMTISILITLMLNRGYHFFMHGYFGEVPLVGRQLIIQPLYLSNISDAQYFKNPEEKILFTNMLAQLEKHQLTKESAAPVLQPLGIHSAYNYYATIYHSIQKDNDRALSAMTDYQKDVTSLSMSKVLYLHSIKQNVIFYLWKISSFFGEIPAFIVFLMVTVAAFFRIVADKKRDPSINQIFILVSLLTILINTAFVSIFEPMLPSYSYYSYFLIYCLGGLIAKKCLYPNEL